VFYNKHLAQTAKFKGSDVHTKGSR